MESNFAKWLDVAFAGFDGSILEFYHRLAEWCGALLSPLMELISFTGEKGLVLLLTALCLGLFSKTRKTGICMFGAICCGALITNIILKETICRVRPYEAQEAFRAFWSFVGAHAESEFSFPSGHTTAAAAAATGLWLTRGKKYLAVSIPYVALMAASRNYFMVHYPTDVIAGAIVGTLAGVIAYFITLGIYRVLIKYENTKFCRFVLDFDVIGSFKRKK
ncbi:MAG: phosphatase PAP2 family protein [Clostridia bacterium]|nr:phosphatase PAP2 family protein [Clostridia bacterium]